MIVILLIYHDALYYYYHSSSSPSHSFPWQIKRELAPVAPAEVAVAVQFDTEPEGRQTKKQKLSNSAGAISATDDVSGGADTGPGPGTNKAP